MSTTTANANFTYGKNKCEPRNLCAVSDSCILIKFQCTSIQLSIVLMLITWLKRISAGYTFTFTKHATQKKKSTHTHTHETNKQTTNPDSVFDRTSMQVDFQWPQCWFACLLRLHLVLLLLFLRSLCPLQFVCYCFASSFALCIWFYPVFILCFYIWRFCIRDTVENQQLYK